MSRLSRSPRGSKLLEDLGDEAEGHVLESGRVGPMSHPSHQQINRDLLRPLTQTSWRFYVLVALPAAMVLAGLISWFSQMYVRLRHLRNPLADLLGLLRHQLRLLDRHQPRRER